MKEQSVSLQCTEGNSDKVYNIQLVVAPISGVLWNVNFQYGRRGNTLTSGTKNSTPLAYEAAFKIFNKLVAEKIGKGYISCPETGGELVTMTSNENKSSDTKVRPQLLNDIEPHLLKHFIDDDNFCAQQKFDGMRRLLIKTGEKIVGANRKGLIVDIPVSLVGQVDCISDEDFILDGEAVGDDVHVFDIIHHLWTYKERYEWLRDNLDGKVTPNIKLVKTAWTPVQKQELYTQLFQANAEGIVFKRIDALYSPGRPNSGGNQFKLKFVETASCIVAQVNETKRSVRLVVYKGTALVYVGNATVYANQPIPKVNDVVEVRYLYWYPDGSIYQPVLLGIRTDVEPEECTISQLKAKPESVSNEQDNS